MSSHLQNRRIVITRPAVDSQRLADRLRSLGAEPVIAPAIDIEFTDPVELDEALAKKDEFDWIVFTSRNGVEAVARRTKTLAGPKIAVIGPATAEAARAHGWEPSLMPPSYVAESVLDAIGDVGGAKILLPRANIARDVLPEGLRARGATVVVIPAYRTHTPTEPLPDLYGVDAITFTSSSTVRGFLARGSVPPGAVVVCIGPVTAATAEELGLEVAAVADEFTEDGLVNALEALFTPSP